MTNPDPFPSRPVGEDDLHDYVDDRLDTARRRVVEAWLQAHPAEAARLRDWQMQAEALRTALTPVAAEAVPARLRVATVLAERSRRGAMAWRRVAAAIALFGCGAAAGWGVERFADRSRAGPPMADAIAAHRVYAGRAPGTAVELVAAGGPASLSMALSDAANWAVPVPDLSALGLAPLGGRVLPSEDGLAVLILYEGTGGLRLSLFVRRSRRDGPALPEIVGRGSPLRAAVWFRNGFGHAVVAAEAPPGLLLHAAALSGG